MPFFFPSVDFSLAKQVLTPHFYGELTRTEEGCRLLRQKGQFSEYARYIREHGNECKDLSIISELKSVLWAVVRYPRPQHRWSRSEYASAKPTLTHLYCQPQGNIGSTPGGLPFLEEEDLIKYIVGMAERSKILSLKG